MKSLALVLALSICSTVVFAESKSELETYKQKVQQAIKNSNQKFNYICKNDIGSMENESPFLIDTGISGASSVQVSALESNETILTFTEPSFLQDVIITKVVADKEITLIKSIEHSVVETMQVNLGSAVRPNIKTFNYVSEHGLCEQYK